MASTFISDADMAKLEQSQPQPAKKVLSDEDIAKLEAASQYSPLESAGRGAMQGATLGFGDEIAGAVQALPEAITSDKKLKDLYQKYRDIQRKKNDEAQKQNPKSFFAGNVVGGLAPVALTGGAAAPETLAGAIGLGASYGAASGLGSSEADLTKGQVGQAAKDTAIGAGIGAGTGAVMHGIGQALAPKNLENKAAINAVKGMGGAPSAENLQTGKTVLQEGLLPLKGGSSAVQAGIGTAKEYAEQEAIPILKKTTEVLGQNPSIVDDIPTLPSKLDELKGMFQKSYAGSDASEVAKSTDKLGEYWAAKFESVGENPIGLRRLRIALDNEIKAKDPKAFKFNNSPDPAVKFMLDMRNVVNEHIGNLVEAASKGAGEEYQGIMQKYSQLIKAESLAGKGVAQDITNPPGQFNLKDFGVESLGATATVMGHPEVGIPVMAAGALKVGAEKLTGQPINRLANIAMAKSQYGLAQGLKTQAGQMAAQGANLTGKSLSSSGVQAVVPSLYSMQDNQLQGIANNLGQSPTTKDIGNSLGNAIKSGDTQRKNQVLFAMQQRPDIRAKLDEQLNGGSSNPNDFQQKDQVDNFLDKVGINESSGGKNFEHRTITSGPQAGQTAIGTFGLLPNTVRETLKRAQDPSLNYLNNMQDDQLKQHLEENPKIERKVARHLVKYVIDEQGGDMEKAAFAWRHGHNMGPDRIEKSNYKNDPYVKNFNK